MATSQFDQDQFSRNYPPGMERMWWSRARNLVIARTLAQHLPADARLLEVGCGTGIVTDHLRGLGWDITGVELGTPRSGVRASAHIQLGTDALDLPEAHRRSITALALFDVIEHVADAPAFLRALLAGFPNATRVAVTVPAGMSLWTNFDDYYGHHRRYDQEMLRSEFAQAGLSTRMTGYFFHALDLAIRLNNLIRRQKRNIEFHAPAPGFASFINAAVAGAFAAEARLLPASWPGSSLIGIGERNIIPT